MLHHLPTWFRKFSKNQKRKLKTRQQHTRRKLARVELLENRVLMAVDLSLTKVGANIHTLAPVEDVMTSAHFQGDDLVRGYTGDNRPTFRVSSSASGPETVYISFNAASIAALGSQIDRAVLTVQSVPGGFGGDASPSNPFTISAHAVDADPFTSITDNTNPTGTTDWLDFFSDNILAADPAAVTVVKDFGALRFDVTGLVQNWAGGANSNFVIALTGKNQAAGGSFLHGIANNTEAPGSTFLTVTTPTTYTVTVNNSGTEAATGVSVSDLVPAHFGTPTNISSGGSVVNGNDVEWTGLTVPAGGSIELTYQVAAAFPGSFMAPSAENGAWDRPTANNPTPNATFQAWEAFQDPAGPNPPQTVPLAVLPATDGAFGGGLGVSWAPYNLRGTADAFDSSSATTGSMIISSGNIYSFSSAITPRVVVPNNIDGVAGDNANGYTTVFVQVHSTGSSLNPDSMRLNGTIEPTEFAATSRFEDGSPGFGTGIRDTWAFEFRVPGNADVYTIDFAALQSHFSFDRIAVDTIWNPTATSASEAFSVGAPYKLVSFAQVTAADQVDGDSTPGNGVPYTAAEDDEAASVFLLGNTPPRISSNGGDSSATTSFNENSTNGVTTVTVVDPQVPSQQLSYSLSGDDAAKFNISPAGVLTFITPPNFESPTDANADNVYQVTVVARDNGVPVTPVSGGTLLPGMADSQLLNITVANVNEAPTDIVLSSATIAENAGANATVGTFSSVDPETGNTFTYTLVAGTGDTGNSAFNISGNTLRANASFDFDVQNSYSIRVRSTDQGNQFFEEVFTISVTEAGALNTLHVTGLTPTSTGFVANFSQPLAAADLNLYGNAALGAPDVTLVGATTGAIRGSLVVNAAGTQITFVATQTGAAPATASSVLPNDTYTVTFRSAGGTATDGFNTAAGAALDGNADGTTGDNYTTTFVVNNAASAVRVSIPDFARGHGQSVNVPNTGTGLPVFLSTGQNVSSLQFTLNYDPSLLNVTGFTPNATLTGAGVSFTVNTSTPGVVVFNITHTTELSSTAGALSLGTLTATVPTTAVYGAKQVLDITGLTVFDNDPGIPQERASIADDAVHVSAYFGDASGNRQYQSNDGTLLARVTALLDSGFAAYQLADPTIIADISSNNQLQSNDGTLLSRFSALINTPQIPTPPAAPNPLPSLAIDPILRIGSTAVASGATTVTVPVTLTVPATETAVSGVSSFQLLVSFDNTQLSFTTNTGFSTTGAETAGWAVTPNQIPNTSPNTNTLVFIVDGGANPGPTGAINPGETITLGSLTFTIQAAVSGPVNVNLLGSYQTTSTVVFLDDFATELLLLDTNGNPAPTNGVDPDNDSVITVGPVNQAPTAVSVTPNAVSLAENTPVPASLLVGAINITDDGLGTNNLTLTGADAASFTISGNQLFLVAGTSLNFEVKPTYTVTVRVDDPAVGATPDATSTFTLNLTNVNETPTDIALSSTTIAENAGVNAVVGNFSTVDPDASNTFTYTLVAGTGDTGNGAFNIDGNVLRANASFDFDTQNSYSVRVRSTDQDNLSVEEEFTITVTDGPAIVDLSITKVGANVHTLAPLEDVMTSAFFQGNDLVRGYPGDLNRATFRVTTSADGPETVYISFSAAQIEALGSQIDRAILTVTAIAGGFNLDPSPANPFTISAHAVNADPFTSITDNTNPGGTINWLDFYNNNILAADPAAITVVKDFGSLRFDVTNLVKNWASGSNTQFVIALTGKNDTSGNEFFQGIRNNNNSADSLGSTFLTVTTPTTYTVTVSNAGPNTATGVSISDVVPAYFGTPTNISNGGTVVNGNDVQWTGLVIPAGGSINLTYQVAAGASGGFLAPTTANGAWNRPTAGNPNPNATFQGWEVFATTTGPNAPGTVPGPAFGGVTGDSWAAANPAGTANAFDSSAPGNGSFVTGGGNIYSPGGVVTPRIVVPNNIDAVPGDNANGYTTILVQIKNGGTELNPDSIVLNGSIAPTQYALIARTGSGMGASDTWAFEFVVPGNADVYVIDMSARESSLSLDRVSVDTIWNPTAASAAEAFSAGAPFKLVNVAQVTAADQSDSDSQPGNNLASEDDQASATFQFGNTPPRISSNGGGNSGTASVSENTSAVTTVTIVDPQVPTQFVTYSLSGTDAALFNVGPDGALTFITPPNFESPTDANGDNVYEVTVTAQDSGVPSATGLADSQSLTITVTAANEAPTIDPQTFTVAENLANGGAVGTVVAADPDVGDTRTFAITAGNTGGAFAINPNTGAITVANSSAMDFETSPTFALTVTVTDAGTLSASNTITVNLTNVNEAPTIDPQTFSLAENSANGTSVGTVVAADVDAGDTRTFAITAGNTGAAFAIDPSTGAITIANSAALNFEATPIFSLTVSVTDAGPSSASNTVTINLTNVNEAPTLAPQTFSIPENLASGTGVGVVTAADVDAGDLRTYAITGGNTGGAFAIDPNTAVITVANASALNFETTPTFSLIVTATDSGSLSVSETITINLTNVNEAPTIDPQTFSVAENSGNGTAVGTVVAADVDAGDTRTFAITGGNTGGAFAINPSTGAITVASTAALNFETTPTFSLTVSVTDAGTLSTSNTVTVNLTNVNEAPTIAGQTFSVAENSANGTAVGTVLANDPDSGDTRTFAITGGNTGGAFAINPSTGAITVANSSALNFEATPTFNLTVSVTDAGSLSASNTITINLTNVNEVVAITVAPTTGLTTTEAGGTATFTIVLASQPTADVTIPLSSSDTTEGTVSPNSVTFTPTNWNIAQTITVTGVDDAVVDGSIAYTIVTSAATSTDPSYNGLAADDVAVNNTDDEVIVPGSISVSPATGLSTTEGGGVAAFVIFLNSAPTANVTIALTSSDSTEGAVAPASVTFTPANWNVPQLVTVTGVDDALTDGNVAYSIVTAASTSTDPSYSGVNAADVSITNFDNETGGGTNTPPTISDIGNQTTNEDTPLTGIAFTVGDAQTAAGSLTVTATSSNPALVPNANLTFGGSGANRTLSIAPAANQSGTSTITITVSDGTTTTSDTFTLTVNPVNDAPTLAVIANPPALPVNAGAQTIGLTGITAGGGETQNLTVTATSSNPALIANPTVTYTSPNSTGTLNFTPVAGQTGTAVITVTVTDDGGTASGGVNTVTRTFTVTVSDSGGSISTPGFVGIVADPEIPGGRLLVINGTSNLDLISVYRYGANQTLVLVPLSGVIRYFDNSAFDRVLINGFAGSDRIVLDPFFSKPTTINGDAGDDIILGGAGNDVIRGGEGVDVIYGLGGHDFIYGDNGNDYLSGDDGNDVVLGGNSDDVIWGGFGADVLNGGAGFDKTYGLSGDDLVIGGNLAQASSQSSLQAIQSLWTANQPFNTRISNLASEINPTNVTSDNSSDWIYGNDGRDWLVDYALLDRFWDLNTNPNNGDQRN